MKKLHLAAAAALAAVFPAAGAARVRPPALAGAWYPGSPALLAAEAQRLLDEPAPRLDAPPLALVVPHAGWQFSGPAAAAAFAQIPRGAVRRVVVLAPSHHRAFDGFAVDDASAYRTPLGDVPLCPESARLADGRLLRIDAAAAAPEHAVEIELPFLQRRLGAFCLIPILAGRTTPAQEAELAARLAPLADATTLFVASSDFTHYGPSFGYTPYGPSFAAARSRVRGVDASAIEAIAAHDARAFRRVVETTGATICGRSGIGALLELLARVAPASRGVLLAHYDSSQVGDPRDEAVDYAAVAFPRAPQTTKVVPLDAPPACRAVGPDEPPLPEALGRRLPALARAALETELSGTDALPRALDALPDAPEFKRLQATFVTLNRRDPREIARDGKLRGCVGQVVPVLPLATSIVESALDAALHDTRFDPVEARELPRLAVEVTVLSAPRPIASWREIQLGRHGIVLEKGGRRALFLPQVAAEQGWTLEQTLDALARKAGLPADAWRSGARFSVFTGQVFEEN